MSAGPQGANGLHRPSCVLGFADEVWWSPLAQPDRPAWAEDKPVRLREMTLPKKEADPKTLAC